jgi:cysteinyl-tRNA synthetase
MKRTPGRQGRDEMELKLYNTLSRTKEVFTPADPKNVRLYVCGPTVYDFAHIGNARPVIVFDVLFRLLRLVYGPEYVTYVRNVTDVDDKINARAAEENVPIRELTERTLNQFHDDIAVLGVLQPTFEPRATESIPEMIAIIEKLLARGCAYVAEGHVLFDVARMHGYGSLSGRSLDEMIAGARVEVAPYKRNPMDFVLWKPSAADLPGWDSPWGRGRPGWHIECSAMSWKYLGETFDIHGGGIDLVFPHHENELAQSRCAFATPLMARVWMHNGFLQVEGRKMAKSEGNFITIRELLGDWPGEVLRFNMLRTHYRQPMDWTVKGLEESRRTLAHFFGSSSPFDVQTAKLHHSIAEAINRLHELHKAGDFDSLTSTLSALGFAGDLSDPRACRVDKEAVEALIRARAAARAAKDWKESDRIRDELAAMHIVLNDSKDGTTWEVKR